MFLYNEVECRGNLQMADGRINLEIHGSVMN